MPNEALTLAAPSPLALTQSGYNTNIAAGGFERAGMANAHRARMEQLLEEQKAIQDARDRLDRANKMKIAANLIGGVATLGLGAAGLPTSLAMAGGGAAGSLTGQSPSSAILGLAGGGLEYGRHADSLNALRHASEDYGWGGSSVLAGQ